MKNWSNIYYLTFFSNKVFNDKIKKDLVEMSSQAHMDMEILKDKFFLDLNRKVYITPKTFLEMNAFSSLKREDHQL